MRSRHFGYFSLPFGITWLLAMLLPISQWADLAVGTLITGLIMSFFAGTGLLGFPMKGTADPVDIALAGAALLLGAAFIYVIYLFY